MTSCRTSSLRPFKSYAEKIRAICPHPRPTLRPDLYARYANRQLQCPHTTEVCAKLNKEPCSHSHERANSANANKRGNGYNHKGKNSRANASLSDLSDSNKSSSEKNQSFGWFTESFASCDPVDAYNIDALSSPTFNTCLNDYNWDEIPSTECRYGGIHTIG